MLQLDVVLQSVAQPIENEEPSMTTTPNPFRPGDRVAYTGTLHRLATVRQHGDRGTVKARLGDGRVRVAWDRAEPTDLAAMHLSEVTA